jgi:hypothetical protein
VDETRHYSSNGLDAHVGGDDAGFCCYCRVAVPIVAVVIVVIVGVVVVVAIVALIAISSVGNLKTRLLVVVKVF